MLHLSFQQRYYLFCGPADMRKGVNGLSGLVTNLMKQNVSGGDVFIFVNRRRTTIKLLQYEGDGFAIYYKCLEKGTYEVPVAAPQSSCVVLSWQQLSLMLQGISLQHIRYRKRYQQPLKNCG